MNRNWAIKRQIPLLKPKREINKYYKLTKYNENKLLTERTAISQKVATQQPNTEQLLQVDIVMVYMLKLLLTEISMYT